MNRVPEWLLSIEQCPNCGSRCVILEDGEWKCDIRRNGCGYIFRARKKQLPDPAGVSGTVDRGHGVRR
jgi:hypothetical protein